MPVLFVVVVEWLVVDGGCRGWGVLLASALRIGKSSSSFSAIVTTLPVSIKSKLTFNGDMHRAHEAPRE